MSGIAVVIARTPQRDPSLPPALAPGPVFRHEIGHDARITGRIHFPADARIDGSVSGDVRADALLLIGQSARVGAIVSAKKLIVEGRIEGEINNCDTCELRPGARIVGRIAARNLIVREGAIIEGWLSIGGGKRS